MDKPGNQDSVVDMGVHLVEDMDTNILVVEPLLQEYQDIVQLMESHYKVVVDMVVVLDLDKPVLDTVDLDKQMVDTVADLDKQMVFEQNILAGQLELFEQLPLE